MSKDPRDRNYNFGLYRDYQFSERDFIIRRDFGLYAEEFIRDKDISLALRRIAKNPPEKFAIFPASEFLPICRKDLYLLYMPISRITQSQPKTEKVPPYEGEGY
jgi:hypothetical protein